jgi:hypothetical protein
MFKRFAVALMCVFLMASVAWADKLEVGKTYQTKDLTPLVMDLRIIDMFTTAHATARDGVAQNKPFWLALQEGLLQLRYVMLAKEDAKVKVLEILPVPAHYIEHSKYTDVKYVKIQYDAPSGGKVVAWTLSIGLKDVEHTPKNVPEVAT